MSEVEHVLNRAGWAIWVHNNIDTYIISNYPANTLWAWKLNILCYWLYAFHSIYYIYPYSVLFMFAIYDKNIEVAVQDLFGAT